MSKTVLLANRITLQQNRLDRVNSNQRTDMPSRSEPERKSLWPGPDITRSPSTHTTRCTCVGGAHTYDIHECIQEKNRSAFKTSVRRVTRSKGLFRCGLIFCFSCSARVWLDIKAPKQGHLQTNFVIIFIMLAMTFTQNSLSAKGYGRLQWVKRLEFVV